MNILIAIAFVAFPALIVWLCRRFHAMNKIGPVILCYIAGLAAGNTGLIPDSFFTGPSGAMEGSMLDTLQSVSVCLALSLLLFSIDVKKWFRVAKKGLLCMLFAVISIVITVFILQLTLGRGNPEASDWAGLSVGVYVGATFNMVAIKTALNVDENTYLLFNTYDVLISFLYLLLMASVARPFLQKVVKLKAFDAGNGTAEAEENPGDEESVEAYSGIFKPAVMKRLGLAFLLAAAILGGSFVIGGLFPKSFKTAVTILSITTLGIAASFIKPVRRIPKTFPAGMYMIYVFCFSVAAMTDLKELLHIRYDILLYVTVSIFGTLAIHTILSKIGKIDSDTLIIVSVSTICSPPFVPVITGAIKNKDVLVTGLTTGIIGYAIGNYLGIFIAWLFERM